MEKNKELRKMGEIIKLIREDIVVLEDKTKNWSCNMTHLPN